MSLVVDAMIAIFRDILIQLTSDAFLYIITGLNVLVSVAIITVVFAVLFKILPDAEIEWKHVWVGAFVTTLLFTLGKYLIGYYLGNSSLNSVYGAARSLVVLLIWVYYSSTIVFIGAEFTNVYSREMGKTSRKNMLLL